MNKLYITFLAGLVSAIFLLFPAFAEDKVCDPVDQEDVVTKGIQESPELLVATLTDAELQNFYAKLRDHNLLIGAVAYDKIYIFKSEKYPDFYYIYFLYQGCIGDVRLTYKSLIEGILQ